MKKLESCCYRVRRLRASSSTACDVSESLYALQFLIRSTFVPVCCIWLCIACHIIEYFLMLLFYNSYMYNNNSKGLVIVVMVYRKFI